jgi:hypothetical protein
VHEQLEPEIELTFPNTKFGKQYYRELIGKERLKRKPKRQTRSLGKKQSPKGKAKRKTAKR